MRLQCRLDSSTREQIAQTSSRLCAPDSSRRKQRAQTSSSSVYRADLSPLESVEVQQDRKERGLGEAADRLHGGAEGHDLLPATAPASFLLLIYSCTHECCQGEKFFIHVFIELG
jgi:hypothetical protein